ncbi:MAG: CaiB/BaiF CoA transferase family protein [Acidobacteriota bacterium]
MPLKAVRVVDLTRILAGPFATMMVGDLGADVIKIERPGSGDDARGWGPPFVDEMSTYFLAVNRNKRSVTLDLQSVDGKALLWKLIEGADVLVSNFMSGVMEKLGFGYLEVATRCPRCVYAVINGYGDSGERREKPSFDVIVQAESGLMDLTGWPDGPPTKVGVSLADEVAGLYLVQGILLALRERQRTGLGQRVEVALHDALLSLFTFQAEQYLAAGRVPERLGNRHPSIVPYETFAASDGTLVVGVGNEAIWGRFCQAVGRPDLRDKPDFATNAERVSHRRALEAELVPLFASRRLAHWERVLGNAHVPCGRVRALHEVLDRERSEGRAMVETLPGSDVAVLGVPVKLSATPGRVRRKPPRLGEHTEEILVGLGYTPEEVDQWRSAGVT